MEMFDKLAYYLQFSQVRYALIVGVLVALCASLLGVTLVLKRFSFIGDGLSHVAFGAMAVASLTGALIAPWKPLIDSTGNMIIVMPLTVLSAVLLLRTGKNAKIKGDAAVAMISVGALAIGYLLMNLDIFPKSANAFRLAVYPDAQPVGGQPLRRDLGRRYRGVHPVLQQDILRHL